MTSAKLNWMEFLNEACTWDSKARAEQYFTKIAGTLVKFTPAQTSAVSELEEYMRMQLMALHFKRGLDINFLNDRLPKVQLQLKTKKSEHISKNLPALSASGKALEKPVQAILDTLYFQFAAFIGGTIDGDSLDKIQRCEALYKAKHVEECKAYYKKFRSLELTWKEELLSPSEPYGELERCSDFFIATPGMKFCSDSCRFNSFSLRKQTKSPGYHSEKQRRYRDRLKAKS